MDLTGKLLIAMPGIGDPRFEQSVIYLVDHNDQGAMGLIVNKPAEDVRLSDLLEQLEIQPIDSARNLVVHMGGPVEGGRGFVLHSRDYASSLQSLEIADAFSMTATLDILEDIAQGNGPDQALMMLGYAGWGAGQLEQELGRNGWLTAEASRELVFERPDAEKWSGALATLGIDPVMLSGTAGRA